MASTAQSKSTNPLEESAAPIQSDNRQVQRPSTGTGSIEQPSVNLHPTLWPSKLKPPPSPPPHPLDDAKKRTAIMENRREHSTSHSSNHQSQAKPAITSSRQQSGAFAPGFFLPEEDPRLTSAPTSSSVGSPTVDGEQPGLDLESDSDDSRKGEDPGYCNACGKGAFFLQECDKCKRLFHMACLHNSRSTGPKHCHPCVRSLIQSGDYGDRSFNASFSSDDSEAHAHPSSQRSDEPRSSGEAQGVAGPSFDPSSSESSSASILNTPSPPRPPHPSKQTRTEPSSDISSTTPASPLKTRAQRARESKTPNSTEEEQSE